MNGLGVFVVAVARRFYADQCLMRASALAYTSLLSLVPLLAVMFAVLKGLGVQDRLEPILLSRLSLDQSTTELIIGYIDRTNVSSLGALSAAMLVLTVVSVLGTIEGTFNYIWRVTRARSMWRQVTDYLGVVLLTPFLLLAGVALTSATQVRLVLEWLTGNGYVGGAARWALGLTPIVMNALGIGILYAVMPNRRLVWRPIAGSALIAGCAWQVVAWGYLRLQIGVAGYSAIYGALAQLPVTLVWLYVSWAIILAGAEIAAVLEFGTGAPRSAGSSPDPRAVALHVLVRAADQFARGGPGVEMRATARELGVEIDAVQRAGAVLQEFGWLAVVDTHPPRLVLARAPATIELGRLDGLARRDWVPPRIDPRAAAALQEVDAKRPELWAGRTLADLL